jgi:hypothetical protein
MGKSNYFYNKSGKAYETFVGKQLAGTRQLNKK